MVTKPPVTYEQYLEELGKKLTFFEQRADKAQGLDERIDVTNHLLIETVRVLREGLKFQLPPAEVPFPGIPEYNVRKFLLDDARAEPGELIDLPGDSITAYTNGSLAGCYIRLESPTADAIPLYEFNPYKYTKGWRRFYLETPIQAGRYLRLHIGREASAEAGVQITATAPNPAFYTLRLDKDDHFRDALATGVKEDENVAGLLGDRLRITNIAIQAKQDLDFYLLFWRKDTFDNTDLDVDTFIGAVQLDLSNFGKQVGGAGQYYMSVESVDLDYEDEDGTHELHVSLYNDDAIAKSAGAAGEVAVFLKYELRA